MKEKCRKPCANQIVTREMQIYERRNDELIRTIICNRSNIRVKQIKVLGSNGKNDFDVHGVSMAD